MVYIRHKKDRNYPPTIYKPCRIFYYITTFLTTTLLFIKKGTFHKECTSYFDLLNERFI